MKFEKHFPAEILRPYIKYYVVSEHENANEYKVLPNTGLVIGFQYKGMLVNIEDNKENKLNPSGITGMTDGYKLFRNSADIGTILVYFTEVGFAHFATTPAHELFKMSIALENIFDKNKIVEIEEKLTLATTDIQRVNIVDKFLLSLLKDIETDKLIVEAIKLIYDSHGTIRIKDLNEKLYISQSPFEKRFRKVVGTTAKKFATIVRFNNVVDNLSKNKSLTEICYEYNFFDQAHFTKEFKQFTGDTPENFKRFL